jgi:hypothetical protein
MSEEGSAPTDVAENSTHQAKPTWNSARAPTGYPDPDDQQHAYGKLVAFSHFNYGQDKSMFTPTIVHAKSSSLRNLSPSRRHYHFIGVEPN